MQEGAEYSCVGGGFDLAENLVYCSRDDACVGAAAFAVGGGDQVVASAGAEHCVGFARTGLSVGEDRYVIAFEDSRYYCVEAVVYVLLRDGGVECLIEGDFKVVVAVMGDAYGSALVYVVTTSERTSTTRSDSLSLCAGGRTLT